MNTKATQVYAGFHKEAKNISIPSGWLLFPADHLQRISDVDLIIYGYFYYIVIFLPVWDWKPNTV